MQQVAGYRHGKDSLFGHCNESTEVSLRGVKRRSNPIEIPHCVRNDTLCQIASRNISIGGVFKPRILLRDKPVLSLTKEISRLSLSAAGSVNVFATTVETLYQAQGIIKLNGKGKPNKFDS